LFLYFVWEKLRMTGRYSSQQDAKPRTRERVADLKKGATKCRSAQLLHGQFFGDNMQLRTRESDLDT
jgi:hypothetical protein